MSREFDFIHFEYAYLVSVAQMNDELLSCAMQYRHEIYQKLSKYICCFYFLLIVLTNFSQGKHVASIFRRLRALPSNKKQHTVQHILLLLAVMYLWYKIIDPNCNQP